MEFKILAHNLSSRAIKEYTHFIRTTEWTMTPYSKRRLEERGLSFKRVQGALSRGELIEYHNVDGNDRFLIRDESGICVVGELGIQYQGIIITAYLNSPYDNHTTLDKSNYLLMGG